MASDCLGGRAGVSYYLAMSIISAQNRFTDLLTILGRAALHEQFPDDFEYYMVTLELVNPNTSKTEDMFVFPVMPDDIRIREPELTDVRKTAGGISVLTNPTYISKEVTLSGSFGRKFRFLLGNQVANFGTAFAYQKYVFEGSKLSFDDTVKTGYGTTKRLMRILNRSKLNTPEGTPYQLFLYNTAFNDNHLVEVVEKSVAQDMSNNMYWKYNLAFKTTAPAEAIRTIPAKSALRNLLLFDVLQRGLTTALTLAKEQGKLLQNQTLGQGPLVTVENKISDFINK